MAIPYAPEQKAKNVINGLRKVFGELRRTGKLDDGHAIEDYGLREFLKVTATSPYDDWTSRLDATYTSAKTADERTADEQEKLCQVLNEAFGSEGGWCALLNRLGRMRIEADVKRLARTNPPPQIVRSSYETWMHTLEFDVGARTSHAKAIVAELFAEQGLKLEKPKDARPEVVPKPPPAVDKPKPTPVPAATPDMFGPLARRPEIIPSRDATPEPVPESKPKSFWGEVLKGAIGVAIGIAEESIARQQRAAADAVNVGGQWRDPSGGVFQFRQEGTKVSVHGAVSGYALSGSGRIERQNLEIEGFSPGYGPFQASLHVSADKKRMTGTVQFGVGQATSVILSRLG